MTRINVVEPSTLHPKHLAGELKEITRVFNLVRKAQDRGINKYNKEKLNIPDEYTMGTGHVKFFYPRLGYIVKRYESLCDEARSRGWNPNQILSESLLEGIQSHWVQDYTPTEKAIQINQQRIDERLRGMK